MATKTVVVGGGAAGLSAALVLGRARRRTLVVDAGEPRNAPAAHMHGYLTRDGMPPAEFLAVGREEIARYGVELVRDRAVDVTPGFTVSLASGRTVAARRLVVATGLRDEQPAVPGVTERFGRDVLHCPYCHGWEVRDRAFGVLATTDRKAIFDLRPDAIIHCAMTDDRIFEAIDDQIEMLEAGINVVASGPVLLVFPQGLGLDEFVDDFVLVGGGGDVGVLVLAAGDADVEAGGVNAGAGDGCPVGFALLAVDGGGVGEVGVVGEVVGPDGAGDAVGGEGGEADAAVRVDRVDGPEVAVVDPGLGVVAAGLDGLADVDGLPVPGEGDSAAVEFAAL